MGDPQDCRQPVTASGQDAPELARYLHAHSRGNHPRLTSSGRSSLGQWLRTQAFRDHQGAKAEVDWGPPETCLNLPGRIGASREVTWIRAASFVETCQRHAELLVSAGFRVEHDEDRTSAIFSGGPPSPGSLTAVDLFGPAFEERVGNNVAAFMAGTLGFVLMVARAI